MRHLKFCFTDEATEFVIALPGENVYFGATHN